MLQQKFVSMGIWRERRLKYIHTCIQHPTISGVQDVGGRTQVSEEWGVGRRSGDQ